MKNRVRVPFLRIMAIIFFLGIVLIIVELRILIRNQIQPVINPSPLSASSPYPSPTVSPSPTSSPSPLSFSEMNARFGPCTYAPTLFYHHVENLDQAQKENHKQFTVGDNFFRIQMQYLQGNGYTVIRMQDVINFFDTGTKLPGKSILLTFDDGYSDFHATAFPILREFGFAGTLFLPTGLTGNTGYVTWNDVEDLKNGGLILVANHTWSHHNVAGAAAVVEKEISTADTQLTQHGLNIPKVFAYPYGIEAPQAITFLNKLNYQLAFTTEPGRTLCKQKRLELPRVRIGNSNLNAYSL